LFVTVLALGCGQKAPSRGDKTIEVTVTTPITDSVLDYQDFTGRLEAYRSVDIRARSSGYIKEAPFKEGDLVPKGAVLFKIEPRLYEADLAQANANLQLAIADRNLQDLNAVRARTMIGSRAMGREEYDQVLASREKSKATVKAMEAARDRATVNLGYTIVICPETGRISNRRVDPGNLAKADDTLLTSLVVEDPIYAYFGVDERTYLDLVGEKPPSKSASSGSSSGGRTRLSDLNIKVLMRLANAEEYTRSGDVDFVDNRLNGNTGTIRLRGVFKNPHGTLKPGLFVRIRLPIGNSYPALLIPDEALQSDQGRKFVYVVDEDNKVQHRFVTLGQAVQGLRVIKEGLKAGERVVVTGMQRVRSGQQVQVKMRKPPQKLTRRQGDQAAIEG
jgi:RND family efflux transporter MFP subunit